MKGKKRSGVDVHVRLPEAIHRKLASSAATNRRTITAELVTWVEAVASRQEKRGET